MPFDKVMGKFKSGDLHSGSKNGPKVKKRSQALAIMLSEKKSSKPEYQSSKKVDVSPSPGFMKKYGKK